MKRKADKTRSGKPADSKKRKHGNLANDRVVSQRREGESTSTHRSAFLEEIRALGGHESDLEFLDDVSSDSAVEFDGPNTLATRKAVTEKGGPLPTSDVSRAEPVRALGSKAAPPSTMPVQKRSGKGKNKAPPAPKGKTIVESRPDWYAADLPDLPEPVSEDILALSVSIDNLKERAWALLEQDAAVYSESFLASSTHKFLSTIMSSGTMTDKVSALTLAVQESPLHNVRAFEALLGLASKKSRSQALVALSAIVDLLGSGLVLPAGRKLKTFHQQPGLIAVLQRGSMTPWNPGDQLPQGLTAAHLMIWRFEDWLKDAYFRVIQLLEKWCSDEIDYSRTRALDFVYGLLREKPEQESNLLKLLVNKLGDKDRKLASRSSYLLLQLQNTHPGMKSVIIHGVEQEIVLRPRQNLRTRYYAVNTLNQTILSNKEGAVASALMRLYFGMFSSMLASGETGSSGRDEARVLRPQGKNERKQRTSHIPNAGSDRELAEKLVSAILIGVNRAAAFVDGDDASLESQLDTLFRIAHSSNFNTSIQALVLIQQLSSTRHVAVDRFYRTLYESLLDPRLSTSSKQAMYLNLLLRSLKGDTNARTVKAFAKRMVQVLILHQPPFACGILYVLSQLYRTFPALATLTEEPEEASEGDDEGVGAGDEVQNRHGYDGRKRDPEHSRAHRTCLWEIIPTLSHFHPSVLVYASSVMNMDQKTQKPDLESHTLIRFLDKLSYRNPKTKELSRGGSIMQPLQVRNIGTDDRLRSRSNRPAGTATVNSAAFWSRKAENVPAEDVFFHEYFSQNGKVNQTEKSEKTMAKIAPVGLDEDEDEDEIWQALTGGQAEDEADEGDLGIELDDAEDYESSVSMPDWESDDASEASMDSPVSADEDDGGDEDDGADGTDGAGGTTGGDASNLAVPGRSKERRRRLRDLPTFASADDYEHLLREDVDI